jgi:hypothetical protein
LKPEVETSKNQIYEQNVMRYGGPAMLKVASIVSAGTQFRMPMKVDPHVRANRKAEDNLPQEQAKAELQTTINGIQTLLLPLSCSSQPTVFSDDFVLERIVQTALKLAAAQDALESVQKQDAGLAPALASHLAALENTLKGHARIADPSKLSPLVMVCAVRDFRQKFTLDDAIGSHACSLHCSFEASRRVTCPIAFLSEVHSFYQFAPNIASKHERHTRKSRRGACFGAGCWCRCWSGSVRVRNCPDAEEEDAIDGRSRTRARQCGADIA